MNLIICSKVDQETAKKFQTFWNDKLKILLNKKFRFALSEAESSKNYDLFYHISEKDTLNLLLQRILEITGISLTSSAKNVRNFLFPESRVEQILINVHNITHYNMSK